MLELVNGMAFMKILHIRAKRLPHNIHEFQRILFRDVVLHLKATDTNDLLGLIEPPVATLFGVAESSHALSALD